MLNRRSFFGALLGLLTPPQPKSHCLEFVTKEFRVTTNFPLEQIFDNQQLQYYESFDVKPDVDIVIEGAVTDKRIGKDMEKWRCQIKCKEAEKTWSKI